MLNARLYKRLVSIFTNVKVHAADVPMEAEYRTTYVKGERRKRLWPISPGEEFRVCCPFCRESRYRLYINHRFGVADEETGTMNLWLAHCWNEECLSDFEKQKRLFEMIFRGSGPVAMNALGRGVNGTPGKKDIRLPGVLWNVEDMMRRTPHHHAIRYLDSRLVDPVYVGRKFEVGFCFESWCAEAEGKLIVPVYENKKLVGWQARRLVDTDVASPKWYTCPGFACGNYLYNYDAAKDHRVKVIVEGAADVWSVGPQGMALFGKSVTDQQIVKLIRCTRPGDVIVVLLDPKQDEKSLKRGEKHHIDTVYARLSKPTRLRGKIIPVWLPDNGLDPGFYDRYYMRDYIKLVAKAKGLDISFAEPKKVVN